MQHSHAGWRVLLAGFLTVPLTMAGGASPSGAATVTAPHSPERAPALPAGSPVESYTVTLVTGDRLMVDRLPGGQHAVTADTVARPGFDGTLQTVDHGGQLYVLPSDVLPLLDRSLDRELFNVSKLAKSGYRDGVPVISTVPEVFDGGQGAHVTRELSSLGGVAATVSPDGQWWLGLADSAAAADHPLAGAGQVWLDEQVTVSLAESAPLVGAPQAWDAQWDGTGVTVAVLDTGIDADHPDLAGKVAAAENFTDSETIGDRHGHGTHVAGIVAGGGNASGGALTGVAPGADLVNAKVLADDGSGVQSAIIAGMEWAVAQGAEVVNASFGGSATDGTDPVSLAVNRLTAEHGVLVVAAAGNSGDADHTIGAPGAADAALTVGSVHKDEELASSSGRGPRVGDFAVKPDLTAPGVEIAAAHAEGTDMGTPVDEHYTESSGTSMAAPHVAGAAAILRQSDPQRSPEELKAQLIGAAVPHPEPDVYQQGAGRLDIPAALAAPVLAAPAPVDLGYLPGAPDTEPASVEVNYTNRTGDPLVLELALDVQRRDGAAAGPELLSVEPEQLTLAPGESEQVTVTVDGSAGEPGLYGGHLTATAGEGVANQVPVGFYQEPEQYDLTITGVARDGEEAGGASSVSILDAEDMNSFLEPAVGFNDGVAQVRVPPGTYSVLGAIHSYDAHGEAPHQTAFVGDPEVVVSGDTTVVLDADEANRITVTPPDPADGSVAAPLGQVGLGYWRTGAEPGPPLGVGYLGLHSGQEFFAAPIGPVALGGFEFYSRWRMGAQEASLAVVDPEPVPLDPVLFRGPAVDGGGQLPLVDVGSGGPGDYQDLEVTGAVVLAERGEVPFEEQEELAAAAGAAALVVSNDVPGRLVGRLVEPATVPTLALTQAEGATLRDLLGAGEVTVELAGTAWSPYLYDLVLVEAGEISADLDYVVSQEELAQLTVGYHNDAAGHLMGETRHFSRPFHSSTAYLHPHIDGPRERVEYVLAGEELSYQHTFYGELPFEAQVRTPEYVSYQAGAELATSGFRQVLRPALLPELTPTTRTADTMQLEIYEWVDHENNHFPDLFGLSPYPGDTVVTRLWRDDELVGEGERPLGEFPMVPEAASYQLELEVAREADWWHRSVATHSAWSFSSEAPAGEVAPLPLLSVDYHLDVDLSNTVRSPELELAVRQQAPELPEVAGAQAWLSYDDGDSWTLLPLDPAGGGRFAAALPDPPAAHSGAGSIRVEAWDADGNQLTQEVIRAWRLPAGSAGDEAGSKGGIIAG